MNQPRSTRQRRNRCWKQSRLALRRSELSLTSLDRSQLNPCRLLMHPDVQRRTTERHLGPKAVFPRLMNERWISKSGIISSPSPTFLNRFDQNGNGPARGQPAPPADEQFGSLALGKFALGVAARALLRSRGGLRCGRRALHEFTLGVLTRCGVNGCGQGRNRECGGDGDEDRAHGACPNLRRATG